MAFQYHRKEKKHYRNTGLYNKCKVAPMRNVKLLLCELLKHYFEHN